METGGRLYVAEEKKPVPLPRLQQDLKLYEGPRHRDGSPSWRILDPVRNRFFEIGWLEFELLARWPEHQSADALIEAVAADTPLAPSDEEVEGFIGFLADNQLIVADRPELTGALRRRWLTAER